MRLTVLSVAFPFAPARSDTAGGAEQVLLTIDEALAQSGHDSVVIASHGSRVRGRLVEAPFYGGVIGEMAKKDAQEDYRRIVARTVAGNKIDIVHMHGCDFSEYLPPPGVPVLATLHLPLAWYSREALNPARPDTYLNCVSSSQRQDAESWARFVPEIENGVPVDGFQVTGKKRTYALCLGRICPEKGYHLAIEAARLARVRLILCGSVFRYVEHERYFDEMIAPFVDAKAVSYAGPVDFPKKRRLLGAARCLLVPSLAPETSSLAAMEALACGTPVVAFPSGALADIVEDGKTGFLVKNAKEMAEAIGKAAQIDPGACRRAAEERFSSKVMASRYIELYGKIITGQARPLD